MNFKKFIFALMLLLVAFSQKEMFQVSSAESLAPVFDYKTTETFNPDMSSDNPAKSNENKDPAVKTAQKEGAPLEDYFHFQLADPKGIYLPPLENAGGETNTNVEKSPQPENKEHTDLKISPRPQEEKVAPETKEKPLETKTANSKPEKDFDLLDNIDVLEDVPSEKTTTEEKADTPEEKVSESPEKPALKEKVEIKEDHQPEEKVEVKKTEEHKAEENPLEEHKNAVTKLPDVPSFTKEDIKDSQIVPPEDEKVEEVEVVVPEDEKVKEDIEIDIGSDVEKVEKAPPIDVKIKEGSDSLDLTTENDNIDYYLKKYTSTLVGEANKTDYQYSLMEPFKQSLFYDVLVDNKYETIELQTRDVTADFKPEAIVSYNIPLGAEGEYACQLMVLVPSKEGLSKVWVSELIPGEIDSVMIQDVNNDAQNDIVSVSTTGGVSLLKSIRVYSFDKSKNTFHTIFALNSIMEGIVNVAPGKILISETFPGGINRAALYVWNGKRFERLEL